VSNEARKDRFEYLTTRRRVVADMLEDAEGALWKFMEGLANRTAEKPYEICGAEDAWHPRHEEDHPDYDEDDLVAAAQCQLPKAHKDMGYRNHLEMTDDGKVWGAWS
jgi:hypothetical protein